MLVELIQIKEDAKGDYFLNPIFVNTQQIVYLSENRNLKQKLQEGKLKLGLNQNKKLLQSYCMLQKKLMN